MVPVAISVTEAPTPLAIGSPAPAFDLPASPEGQRHQLADYAGKNLVIVFYPKDQTPGCTKQLCALRDDVAAFTALNTAILGSNPGSLASHQKFAEKQAYPFPILVDADKTMAAAYGALKPEGGIQRTVYIIDGQGIIRFAQQGSPKDELLLNVIRELPA
jgi:thioredoxin-dependent peroxiredoxin